MKINWLMVLPLVLSLALIGLAANRLINTPDAPTRGISTAALPATREGSLAPDLDLRPLDQIDLLSRDDLTGNGLVMVNFWASWCVPCRAEHPTLTALAEAGTPLYGINYLDQPEDALAFLTDLGNPYALIGADPDGSVGRNWGVSALPETFFINDDGVIVLHFRGPIVQRSLRNQVIPALAAAGYDLPVLAAAAE
jgi:cytochrome c biogenesis protein CcmG, thiol:disulfide interchange protein DsbE